MTTTLTCRGDVRGGDGGGGGDLSIAQHHTTLPVLHHTHANTTHSRAQSHSAALLEEARIRTWSRFEMERLRKIGLKNTRPPLNLMRRAVAGRSRWWETENTGDNSRGGGGGGGRARLAEEGGARLAAGARTGRLLISPLSLELDEAGLASARGTEESYVTSSRTPKYDNLIQPFQSYEKPFCGYRFSFTTNHKKQKHDVPPVALRKWRS